MLLADRKILLALTFGVMVVAGGTAGYMWLEHYNLIESFYMAIITITTVGFGEVRPLSVTGRLFTTFLILLGFVVLAFAGRALVEPVLERVWSGKTEKKRMRARIDRLQFFFIICGFGRAGVAAAERFAAGGIDFVILEADEKRCQLIEERGYPYIQGDATREALLLEAGIKKARGILALLSSDPENLFIVLTAREVNPILHIIARAEDPTSEKRMLRAGADAVISPFATAGRQIAEDMLRASGRLETAMADVAAASRRSLPEWFAVAAGSELVGRTLAAACRHLDRPIIGLRRGASDWLQPEPETLLEASDQLLVLTEATAGTDSTHPAAPAPLKKLVLIDDNPIILKLYSRLFRKAGFAPLTATNGHDGLELIRRERPLAAVIDFMLPIMSGVEVCREIRRSAGCEGIKLVLFTADERSETKERALQAGADAVVLKSPEAREVIEEVIRVLG